MCIVNSIFLTILYMEPVMTIVLFSMVTIGSLKWILNNTGQKIEPTEECPPYEEPPSYEEIVEN